jgi:4-amino-4-deoxy-L-arabinose transferase-like glycosyltransferase
MRPRVSPSVAALLAIVVLLYLAIGTLYAILTPIWQVPDEPAHYNYIRSLAEGRGFPILEARDYTQGYLEHLTSEGFPPELSVAPLEYEDHQPPLYYLLATPVFLIFDGAVRPLRMLSVVLGVGLLLVTFGTVRTVFPSRPALGLLAVAFTAFIPQHVAMSAGVNNDTLAELVVGGTLWALMVYVGSGSTRSPKSMVRLGSPQARSPGSTPSPRSMVRQSSPQARSRGQERKAERREYRPWRVGLLLGTALLTKTTAYVVVGVAVAAVAIRWHREQRQWRWAAGQLAWMLIPALLISAPWFIRNGLTYGWGDPMGLARHETIVEGQPRTSEWLATHGLQGLVARMGCTTFHSFWGQFGWMALPLPQRFYQALALLSVLLTAGFVAWLITSRPDCGSANRTTCQRLSLLALSALLTFAAFLWYNLTFVQHQGRYLFPALIPLATAAALGLDTLARILPEQWHKGSAMALFAGMAVLDIYCLFRIIIPNL